jgi:hypothetical protein
VEAAGAVEEEAMEVAEEGEAGEGEAGAEGEAVGVAEEGEAEEGKVVEG